MSGFGQTWRKPHIRQPLQDDGDVLWTDLDTVDQSSEPFPGHKLRAAAGEWLITEIARFRMLFHRDAEQFHRLGGRVIGAFARWDSRFRFAT